jgi:hypothetical protein
MEIHEMVHKLMELSKDDRLTKEEQDLLFASAVRLATYRKTIDDMHDRTKRLYEEMTKEKNVQ